MTPRNRLVWMGLMGTFFCASAWAKADGSLLAGLSKGTGCTPCHGAQSSAVTVTLSGPTQVAVSDTQTYTVSVSGGPLGQAGVDVGTSGGTLAPSGTDTKLNGADVVHSASKLSAGNKVDFLFKLTAPSEAGTVTLTAAGNSVNMDNQPSDLDDWNFATPLTVTVTAGPTTADGGTGDRDGEDEGGGCSATGGSLTVLAFGVFALALLRRAR